MMENDGTYVENAGKSIGEHILLREHKSQSNKNMTKIGVRNISAILFTPRNQELNEWFSIATFDSQRLC